MDRQLSHQKSCLKSSVMKTEKLVFQEKSLCWHLYSRFVMKTTETPVFMFSCKTLTNFWINNWRSIFDVVERLCLWLHNQRTYLQMNRKMDFFRQAFDFPHLLPYSQMTPPKGDRPIYYVVRHNGVKDANLD